MLVPEIEWWYCIWRWHENGVAFITIKRRIHPKAPPNVIDVQRSTTNLRKIVHKDNAHILHTRIGQQSKGDIPQLVHALMYKMGMSTPASSQLVHLLGQCHCTGWCTVCFESNLQTLPLERRMHRLLRQGMHSCWWSSSWLPKTQAAA